MTNYDYNGVSRRALIRVNEEYDEATDGQLSKFYAEKEKTEYIEPIRFVEKATVKVDSVVDHISSRKGPIMKAISKKVDNAFDNVMNSVVDSFDKYESDFTERML